MQRIQIMIPGRRRYGPGDAFEIFSNRGRGEIDYARPLTGRPVLFWPDAEPMAGHLLDAHLRNRHLAAVGPQAGHLEGSHLTDHHLWPDRAMIYESPPCGLGRFRFSVRITDGVGNVTAPTIPELEEVINSDPGPPSDFVAMASEGPGGRMTFRFRPARRLM